MNKKKIMLIGGIAGAVIILGVAAFLLSQSTGAPLVLRLSLEPSAASASAAPESVELPPPSADYQGIMVDLGAKVVNLADPGGYRYLRAGLVLEFAPPSPAYFTLADEERKEEEAKIIEAIDKQRPIIDDVVISHLSNKAFSEIFTFEGKESLKQELSAAINERLSGLQVDQVYFTDFVVQ